MSLTGFLSYSRVNWQQSPSKSTPLSAANLNTMDAGIKNNNDMISNLRDEVTQLNSNQVHYDAITIDEADDIDAFIKKIMNYIISHYEGTFAIRGAWTSHDFFFVTGASWKSDICFGIISIGESTYMYKYQKASEYVFYKQL